MHLRLTAKLREEWNGRKKKKPKPYFKPQEQSLTAGKDDCQATDLLDAEDLQFQQQETAVLPSSYAVGGSLGSTAEIEILQPCRDTAAGFAQEAFLDLAARYIGGAPGRGPQVVPSHNAGSMVETLPGRDHPACTITPGLPLPPTRSISHSSSKKASRHGMPKDRSLVNEILAGEAATAASFATPRKARGPGRRLITEWSSPAPVNRKAVNTKLMAGALADGLSRWQPLQDETSPQLQSDGLSRWQPLQDETSPQLHSPLSPIPSNGWSPTFTSVAESPPASVIPEVRILRERTSEDASNLSSRSRQNSLSMTEFLQEKRSEDKVSQMEEDNQNMDSSEQLLGVGKLSEQRHGSATTLVASTATLTLNTSATTLHASSTTSVTYNASQTCSKRSLIEVGPEDFESPAKGIEWTPNPGPQIASDKLQEIRRRRKIQRLCRPKCEVIHENDTVGLPIHASLAKDIHTDAMFENASTVQFKEGVLSHSKKRADHLFSLIRGINAKMKKLQSSTMEADTLSFQLHKAERPDEESEEEEEITEEKAAEKAAEEAEEASEEAWEEIDYGPIPDRLVVENIGLVAANGVYFIDNDTTHHGRAVYRKQVGDWCVRWQDRHNQIDQVGRSSKEGIGWVLGFFTEEDFILARCAKNIPHPAAGGTYWEVATDTGWEADASIKVKAAQDIPEVLYIHDGSGGLGGVYYLSDNVDGRPSYLKKDDDEEDAIVIRWNLENQRWLINDQNVKEQDVSEAGIMEDVSDPTAVIGGWQRWDKENESWVEDKSLSCNMGHPPPVQVYITGAKGDHEPMNGVYDIQSEFHEGRPAYKKAHANWAVRWQPSASVWIVDERGLMDDEEGMARSAGNEARHPDEVQSWTLFEVTWIEPEKTRQLLQEAIDNPDVLKPTPVYKWVHQPDLLLRVVETPPAQIFLNVGDSLWRGEELHRQLNRGPSTLQDARGVYDVKHEKRNDRVWYFKATGSWTLEWSSAEASWLLSSSRRPGRARTRADIPNPSVEATWEVLENKEPNIPARKPSKERESSKGSSAIRPPSKDRLQYLSRDSKGSTAPKEDEYVPSPQFKVDVPGLPPRKLYVRGDPKEHALYGVYFLRGTRNGRPCFGKEATSMRMTHDRGTIKWEPTINAWQMEASPSPGEKWQAHLYDDMPHPAMDTSMHWEVHDGPVPKPVIADPSSPKSMPMPVDSLHSRAIDQISERRGWSKDKASAAKDVEKEQKTSVLNIDLKCIVADVPPPAVFLSGYSHTVDGVYYDSEEVIEGRNCFRKKIGESLLRWNRKTQRWMVDVVGKTDGEDALLSICSDVPDPSLVTGVWEERVEIVPEPEEVVEEVEVKPLTRAERDPNNKPPPLSSAWTETLAALKRTSLEISELSEEVTGEKKEEEAPRNFKAEQEDAWNAMMVTIQDEPGDDEPVSPSSLARDQEGTPPPEDKFVLQKRPSITCCTVGDPPKQIYIAGREGPHNDINGVYTIVTDEVGQGQYSLHRPMYRTEIIGQATPWTMRYIAVMGSWIIERVPQMQGRKSKFQAVVGTSSSFSFARMKYDTPDPTLGLGVWQVREGENWETDEFTQCKVVEAPPEKIFFLGSKRYHQAFNGTFMLRRNQDNQALQLHQGRPSYERQDKNHDGSIHGVRWFPETKRWILDHLGMRNTQSGTFAIACNSPNPLLCTGVWLHFYSDKEGSGWDEDPYFACYEGEMPPFQLFVSGGKVGVSGVYTFVHRTLHDGKFLYQKDNSDWCIRWIEQHGRWVIDSQKDNPEPDGSAYAAHAVPHPAAAPNPWKVKERKKGKWDVNFDEDPVRCVAVPPSPKVVVVSGRDGAHPDMLGVYFLADRHKERCCYKKQGALWAIRWHPGGLKWIIDDRGLKEDGKSIAYNSCDAPNPALAVGTWSIRKEQGRSYTKDPLLQVNAPGDPPPQVFVFGAPRQGSSKAINGVYTLHPDGTHNERPLYMKEHPEGTCWIIRYYPPQARWVIETKGPVIRNDDMGNASVICDSWHPGAVDRYWHLLDTSKDKAKFGKGKRGSLQAAVRKMTMVGALGGDANLAKTRASTGNIDVASLAAKTRGSEKGTNKSGDDGASITGKSKSSWGAAQSDGGSSDGKSSHAHSIAESRMSAGRSSIGGLGGGRSQHGGGSQAGGSQAGIAENAEEVDVIEKPKLSPKRASILAKKRGSLQVSKLNWSIAMTINCERVYDPPQKLYISPLGEGKPHFGIYELAPEDPKTFAPLGYGTGPDGRPAYIKGGDPEEGVPPQKWSVPPDYAIHWHAKSGRWIMSEYRIHKVVQYPYMRPMNDVQLQGGNGNTVTLKNCEIGGDAYKAGVIPGAVLVRVNDDEYDFMNMAPEDILREIDTPARLEFKINGYNPDGDGYVSLDYDAPDPTGISGPWMVFDIREDEVEYEGVLWTLPQIPIFCRSVRCPPREIEVIGHEGKPRDMNGRFQLLPILHEGRPAYQREKTLWTIRWMPLKYRWLVDQEGLNTHDKGVARAVCNAPNPVIVPECGGFWECHRASMKRGIRVIVPEDHLERDVGPISEAEYCQIIQRTLKKAVEDAQDQRRLTLQTAKGLRFNTERITAVARTLESTIIEAQMYGVGETLRNEAREIRRCLSGWLLIEDLATQAEQPRDKLTFHSWVDLLQRIKHKVRNDAADPTVTNEAGWTPLHFVVRYGVNETWTHEAAQVLMEGGADLDQLDNMGLSPILLAAAARQRENTRALLKLLTKRAESLPLELYGYSSNAGVEFLHEAETGELQDIRPFVLAKTVDLDYRDLTTGRAALHFAAERNKASMVDLLAREKANVNISDKEGKRPLHVATAVNSYISVMVLLRNGASPIPRDDVGCTPYMVALEKNVKECLNEFNKHMAPWSDIEDILCKERTMEANDWRECVRTKVKKLTELGFGDSLADPLKIKEGEFDRFQIANQIVVRDPDPKGSGACICLEPRGVILCKELLKPLLLLAAECQLERTDFIKYKHFTRYLLMSGISVFAGVEIVFAIQNGIEALDKQYSIEYEIVRPDLKDITTAKKGSQPAAQELIGRAHEWTCWHQFCAHGKLDWLSYNWSNRSTVGALSALVEADCFPTVQDVCEFAVAEEFDPIGDKAGTPALSSKPGSHAPTPGPNASSTTVPVGSVAGSKPPSVAATPLGGSRAGSVVLQPEDLPSSSPPPEVTQPRASSKDASNTGTLAVPSHVGPIQNDQVHEAAKRSSTHALVEQNNMMIQFWDSVYGRWLLSCAKKIDPKVQTFAREKWGLKHRAGPLKDQKVVMEHKEKFRKMSNEYLGQAERQPDMPSSHPFEAGGFTDLCRFSVTCDGAENLIDIVEDLRTASLLNDGIELVSISNGWAQARDEREYKDVKIGLVFEAPGGKLHIVEAQLAMRRYLTIRRHRHLLHSYEKGEYVDANNKMRAGCFERVKGTSAKSEQRLRFCTKSAGEQCVWWWAPDFRVKEGGYMEVPFNAITLTNGMDCFEELSSADGGLEEDASLEGVVEEGKDVDPIVLRQMLDEFQIQMEEQEVEMLRVELVTGGARLFRDPASRLTRVRDYIQLRVLAPNREGFLVRETQPRGFVTGLRNSKEPIMVAARRIANLMLPKCVAISIELQDFHKDDGVWITPHPSEVENSIRNASRYFVVRATFVEEPHPVALMQAGLLGDIYQ